MGQLGPRVNLSPSPVQTIRLSSLSETMSPSLSALKSNVALASSLVAVSNQSDQAIVAISALWRIRDAAGREQRSRQRCDTFLPAAAGKVLVNAKSTLYLGPNTCIAEQSPTSDLSGMVTMLERQTIDRLQNAIEIDIVVDAVMFQNGDMFAVDSSYANDIQERVAAANDVATYVRSELAKGQTRLEVQASLSDAGLSRPGQRGAWFRDFATALSRQSEQAFDSYLASLERLSPPRITVRTD